MTHSLFAMHTLCRPVALKPVAAPQTAPKPKKKPPQVVKFTPETPDMPATAAPASAGVKVPPMVKPKPKKERSPER